MNDILSFLHSHTNDILADVETLVRIESPSRFADGVNRIQDVSESWLKPFGTVMRHRSEFGDVLHAHIQGRSADRIVLLAHMDTVYPLGSWKDLWWIDGENAFGPGTYDMKAGMVQALWALRALRAAGRDPGPSVDLLLTPDEEIGSDAGRPFIEGLARGAQAVLVLEAPFMNGDLKVARKGVGDYHIEVFGKAAHQGLEPERGRNAVVSAAHFITQLMTLQDSSKGTTLGPNVIHGGTVSNVVADHATLDVDLRVWTVPEAERVDAALRAIAPLEGTRYEITGGLNRPPMERTKGVVDLYRKAKMLARDLGVHLEESSTGGGSDGNFTAPLCPTLDGIGTVGEGAHAPHESILVDRIADRTALLAKLVAAI